MGFVITEGSYAVKIAVCVKQVPDTETKIKLTPDGKSVDLNGIKWIVNPYDEYAIEEAIKTRDANPGSQIMVYSVGPKKRTIEAVRTALAMGCDEGVLIDGPDFIDPGTTAKALAAAITKIGGADVIFSGKVAIDDNAQSVPQMLAEALKIPHTSVVVKFEKTPEGYRCEREADGGNKEVVMMTSPAVVGATKGLNMPRYASLPGIMKAKKKTLQELDLAGLGVSFSQDLVPSQYELPPEKPAVQMLAGEVDAQVKSLVSKLRDEAKVL